MPDLNTLGEWASGTAGVGVYWQGGPIWIEGGMAQWWTPDEIVGQRTGPLDAAHPAVGLYARQIRTGVERLLIPQPISRVAGSGAGHWAIQNPDGVRDSFGRLHRGVDPATGQAGPSGLTDGAVGPDGSIAIKRLYLSGGPWDVVEPDSTRWQFSDTEIADLVNYGGRRLTWRDGAGAWHAVGLPVPLPLTAGWWFRYVAVGADLWQLYQMADGRLVLHPRGDPFGYELDQGPNAFRPDAVRLSDGRVRVAWSIREGDPPSAIRVEDVSLSAARVDLSVPPPPPMPPVESMPLLHRVFGVACYCFNDAPSQGNLTIPIRPTAKQFAQPIILPSDRPDLAWGNDLWAVYAGENAGLTCEAAIDQARPLGNDLTLGLAVYQDSPGLRPSVADKMIPDDVGGCILKREPTESPAAFKARIRRTVTGEWPSVHLVDTPARAAETVIAVAEIAAEGWWTGFSLFAIGRADVPDLSAYLARLMSGITGTPKPRVLTGAPMSIRTAVSHLITSFPQRDFDNPIETRPAHSPADDAWETVEVVKNSDGTYSVKSGDGDEWLSIQRNGSVQSRPVSDPSQPRSWEKFDKRGNTLVERNKDAYGGFIPPTRGPVTLLVAGSL